MRYEIQNSNAKVILVTSNQIGEGKSLFIEALSQALSRTQKKVLVIDANFSNNSLTQLFEADSVFGKVGQMARKKMDVNAQISASSIEKRRCYRL